MKIIVKVPETSNKWKLHWAGFGKHFTRADTLINGIERRLLRTAKDKKLSILVKYDKDSSNESLASLNPAYLLYTLSCFLEDYLSAETLRRIEKKYGY